MTVVAQDSQACLIEVPGSMQSSNKQAIPVALKSWKIHSGHWLTSAVVIGLFSGLLLIVQAWLLAKTVNAIVFDQKTFTDALPWIWGMLALFLVRAGLSWASEQAAFHAASRVKLALREKLYDHIRKLGPSWLSGERTGDVVNTLSDGVEALEAYYARYIPAMSLMVFVPLAILVFVFPNDWISGLVMLFTAPLIPFFMILIGKGTEKRNQKQWKELARMSAHFLDVIQGLTTLKLFNASCREAKMIASISDKYRLGAMSVLRIAFLSSFVLEFFSTVSIAIVAVLIGFRLFYGEMDFFHGFFVLLLAPEFYLPLRNMGTQYHARMEAIGAAERMIEILNTEPVEVGNTHGAITDLPDLNHSIIRFDHIVFNYPDGRTALKDFNLEIEPGETLALVGASGSGKTTAINLLLGFIQPQSGKILINNTPLSDIASKAWWKQLVWLPQKPQLFTGSIADNIKLGQTQANKRAVIEAARLAHAAEFIDSLPDGYDTIIGESGHGLSGGQLQRIALARAFLKNAPLVILDEATANLDMQSEALVQAGIQQLTRGRTVIMIAHRLRTVQEADRIAVVDNCRITETGKHHELLETSVIYRNMIYSSNDYYQGGGQ